MGMVAPQQRIASAFVVFYGRHGEVTKQAKERGVCRQWIYREAAWVHSTLQGKDIADELTRLRQQVQDLEKQLAEAHQRLVQSVELNESKQKQLACVGQALGVSLPDLHRLLEVLLGAQTPSVAKLGRWTRAAGKKSAALLAVLDEWTQAHAQQAAADEIYVRDPVYMVVEPESLCWLSGRLQPQVKGAAWAEEFRQLPALTQVTRDGGHALQGGIRQVNEEREQQGLPPLTEQLDHFHVLRSGGIGLRRAEASVWRPMGKAEACTKKANRRARRGQSVGRLRHHARAYWCTANQAFDRWEQRHAAWQRIKQALQLFTPEGELNTRARAERVLAEALPQLPERDFARAKRMLQEPATLNYLDEVHRQLEALPAPAEVRAAAVRQEGLRRRPELLTGESRQAAALRGVMLVCAVVLAQAGGIGQETVEAVRKIFRTTWRASSLVECINSVLRMQQARHRKLTQGLLDLKRLYWNCHVFRTGRRRGQSPYQRIGVPWPSGRQWWDILQWQPEQLRQELSTVKAAA